MVFSCSLLHEATPVTRGERYGFLPFLYDDEGARIREENEKYLDQRVMAADEKTVLYDPGAEGEGLGPAPLSGFVRGIEDRLDRDQRAVGADVRQAVGGGAAQSEPSVAKAGRQRLT